MHVGSVKLTKKIVAGSVFKIKTVYFSVGEYCTGWECER